MKPVKKIDWTKLYDTEYKEVEIDGLGTIKVKKEMNGKDLINYFEQAASGQNGTATNMFAAAFAIHALVVDDDNNSVFNSVDDVLQLPSNTILSIAGAINNIPMLSDGQVEEQAKK